MDCITTPTCENSCNLKTISNTDFNIQSARVSSSDTDLTVFNNGVELPCSGFGWWTGCNGGQEEMFYYSGVEDVVDQSGIQYYKLTGVTRGLTLSPLENCVIEGSTDRAYDHSASEELRLADIGIFYYQCLSSCAICALFEEIRFSVNNVNDLYNLADPKCGQVVAVYNSGKPLIYKYFCLSDGTKTWKPINASVTQASQGGLGTVVLNKTPSNALAPEVYTVAADAFKDLYDGLTNCNGILKLAIPLESSEVFETHNADFNFDTPFSNDEILAYSFTPGYAGKIRLQGFAQQLAAYFNTDSEITTFNVTVLDSNANIIVNENVPMVGSGQVVLYGLFDAVAGDRKSVV